jgi:hypothetical protein
VSRVAALAMKRGKSVDFTGYWQRHLSDYSPQVERGVQHLDDRFNVKHLPGQALGLVLVL